MEVEVGKSMKKSMDDFIREQLALEEELLLQAVENDAATHDIEVSEKADQEMFSRLSACEEKADEKRRKDLERKLAENQAELVNLQKRLRRSKWIGRYVAAAAVLCLVMTLGMTSYGGPEKVFETLVQTMKGEGTSIKVNVDDGDSIEHIEKVEEKAAYENIRKEWGVDVVQLNYLPEGTAFDSLVFGDDMQMAKLFYRKGEKLKITYQIMLKGQVMSKALKIEETVNQTYTMQKDGVQIEVTEYVLEQSNRWLVSYKYNETQYLLWISDEKQENIEKVVENLFFF